MQHYQGEGGENMNKKQKKMLIRIHYGLRTDRSAVPASGGRLSGICTLHDPISGDRL